MRNRSFVSAIAVTLLCTSAGFAQTWGSASTGAETLGGTPRQFAGVEPTTPVIRLLAKRVEGIDWDELTFDEVLSWLRDESDRKVNIIPRWAALAIEGIDQDKTVTLKLDNTTVGEVLSETLDQIDPNGTVTFRGERNTLRISTVPDFDRKLELRVYAVTDILFRIPDFSESAPQIDLQRASQRRGGGGGGSGQGVFSGGSSGGNQEELSEEGDDEDPEQILEDLAQLIRDTIEPLSWEPDGGANRIRGYGKRSLVVLAPISVHEQIAGWFSRTQ